MIIQLPIVPAGTPLSDNARMNDNRIVHKHNTRYKKNGLTDTTSILISITAVVSGAFIAYKAYQLYKKNNKSSNTMQTQSTNQALHDVDNIKSVKNTESDGSNVISTLDNKLSNQHTDITLFLQRYSKQILHSELSHADALQRIDTARIEASKTYEYRCIRENRFATARINYCDTYHQLKNNKLSHLFNDRPFSELSILDIGCCFGTDIRAMILDGASIHNVFGIDLKQQYIDIGLNQLFCDQQLMADRFAVVDILQLNFAKQSSIFAERVSSGIDVIYIGSVYHLLSYEQSSKLTHIISLILNANPTKNGGLLFGRTVGSIESYAYDRTDTKKSDQQLRYMHNIQSFTAMLQSEQFTDIHITHEPVDMPSHLEQQGKTAILSFSARRPFTPDQ